VKTLFILNGPPYGPARRSSLEELADWTVWADKVVTF